MNRNFNSKVPPTLATAKRGTKTENIFDGLSPPGSPIRQAENASSTKSGFVAPKNKNYSGTLSVNPNIQNPPVTTTAVRNPSVNTTTPQNPVVQSTNPGSKNLNKANINNVKITAEQPVNYINSNRSFSSGYTPETLSAESSVENKLAIHGYITEQRIITQNLDGSDSSARYLKVINTFGHTIYVDPTDIDGWVHEADIIVHETDSPSQIPASIREGTYQLTASDVYGIAFESNGEITTIVNDDRRNPVESVFRTLGSEDTNQKRNTGTIISYPIFRMSDIITNNEYVLRKTTDILAILRNTEIKSCIDQSRSSSSDAQKLSEKLYNTSRLIDNSSRSIGTMIIKLEGYKLRYNEINSNDSDDNDKEKSRIVSINLKKRHDMIINLIKACTDLASYGDQIRDLTSRVDEVEKFIQSNIVDLGTIYRE